MFQVISSSDACHHIVVHMLKSVDDNGYPCLIPVKTCLKPGWKGGEVGENLVKIAGRADPTDSTHKGYSASILNFFLNFLNNSSPIYLGLQVPKLPRGL